MPSLNPRHPHHPPTAHHPHHPPEAEPAGVLPALLPQRPRPAQRNHERLGLGVPAYAHPLFAPGEWAELGRPGIPLDWVVINVSLGPGVRPDPMFLDATAKLRDAGVRLLGYLDTVRAGGMRGNLMPEAIRHFEWYRVDGFFLDRLPIGRGDLPECRRTVSTLRALLGTGHIVLNHGVHPDPGYAGIADQLVTFAGPWSTYRWMQVPEWTAGHPPEKFCHLVHGVPERHLQEALRVARWQGAATIYLTDRSRPAPWEGLPSYWDRQVRMVRAQPPPCR